MRTSTEERILKASWHMLISAVGFLELERGQSTFSRVLSVGLIAYHLDGALNDIIDEPSTVQRILRSLRP
jgi:hypothetical protein